MSKRITCISLFDKNSINKIDNLVKNMNIKLCKVPYLEKNRESVDTLPYHITIHSWNEDERLKAIEIFKGTIIDKIKLKVKGFNIKDSYKKTYNLYLEIEQNEELKDLYKRIYSITKKAKYNPELFIPHITIHTSNNYNELLNIKSKLEKNFEEFEIEFEQLGLFEIYPAIRIL